MDFVKESEVKVNIKSYARNPIRPQDLMNKEICIDSTVYNQKKRPREEDSSELTALPQAKRHATTSIKKCSQQKTYIINYLRTLYPNFKFNLEAEEGTSLEPSFRMSAMLGGRKFFGHGKTKFLASNNVAIEILNYLENNTVNTIKKPAHSVLQPNNQECQKIIKPNIPENEVSSTLLLASNLSDIIESKIMQRFDEITCRHKEYRYYKVLAGIVMTHNLNFENSVAVSIATGTKCVLGGNMCRNGTVLNDSHAEIIAKRGLMRFLFDNLAGNCYGHTYGIQIFQRNPNNSKVPFKLNPNIHFHLYINTAPCGDARVYNFKSKNIFNGTHYGQLRTKIEGELGTQTIGSRHCHQTWFGVQSGEPLHTMSCSDKIALWNVVGIQGALLSQFIEPIYLHSIVLGSMFNAQHLYRAVCGRIEHNLGYLPEPYRLHRPLLGQTSKKSLRGCIYKAPAVGINWSMGDIDIEVISPKAGRTIFNQISILSKNVFFNKFSHLCRCFNCLAQITNYADAKNSVKDFQTCKREVFEAFSRAGLGIWIKKPIEQNQFFAPNLFYSFCPIIPSIIVPLN